MEKDLKKKINIYFQKGLNSKEIGLLLSISPRTVQRYIKTDKIRENAAPKTLQQKAVEFVANGFSYSQTARRLKVSKTTIYLWLKKIKQSNRPTATE